jgi:prepilin-type N-terminal cleavage/methylation domain-containing protein
MRIGNVNVVRSGSRAFTLIELILVMALLVIVIAVTFPSLQKFFRGRTLESEGRRFLTLTRYAQSRAVAEGIPMTLWVDPLEGTYGLEAQKGFLDRDDKAVEYTVEEKLDIEVAQTGLTRAQLTQEQQLRRRTIDASRNAHSEIRFAPDGSIDVMTARAVRIGQTGEKDRALWVVLAENRNAYEVQSYAPNQGR